MTNEPDKFKKKEGAQLEQLKMISKAFADRDCFPSIKLRKVRNQNLKTNGYEFEFANGWYTGQPVSTLNSLKVSLNGKEIDENKTYLNIRDQIIPIKVAKTLYELWWGYGEVAKVFLEEVDEKIITPKTEVVVSFQMRTTIPYGFPNNMVNTTLSRSMEVI
jgi:hypothetical protein